MLKFVETLADSGWFCEQCGEGGCSPPGPSLDCHGSPLHRLLARVGLGAGSIVLELAGRSFTFPGFMNRFLSRLLFWTSPVLESFYGCWSWSRKEPRNSCHFSLGCAFGTMLLFSNPAGVFSFFIWLNKRILIICSVHGEVQSRNRRKQCSKFCRACLGSCLCSGVCYFLAKQGSVPHELLTPLDEWGFLCPLCLL